MILHISNKIHVCWLCSHSLWWLWGVTFCLKKGVLLSWVRERAELWTTLSHERRCASFYWLLIHENPKTQPQPSPQDPEPEPEPEPEVDLEQEEESLPVINLKVKHGKSCFDHLTPSSPHGLWLWLDTVPCHYRDKNCDILWNPQS